MLKENLSWFTIDALKTLTKNYLTKFFLKISKTYIDCYDPLKEKNRSNHNKFMTEKLRKEVMMRSRLSNKYDKNRTYENW